MSKLGSLSNAVRHLERKHGDSLPPAPKVLTPSEQAEQDRVESLLERATMAEHFELLSTAGIGITELHAIADGAESVEWDADPVVEAKILRRIDLRSRLGLPDRACVRVDAEPEAGACRCLEESLDQAAETATRAAVMRVASKAHAKLWKCPQRATTTWPGDSTGEARPAISRRYDGLPQAP